MLFEKFSRFDNQQINVMHFVLLLVKIHSIDLNCIFYENGSFPAGGGETIWHAFNSMLYAFII